MHFSACPCGGFFLRWQKSHVAGNNFFEPVKVELEKVILDTRAKNEANKTLYCLLKNASYPLY